MKFDFCACAARKRLTLRTSEAVKARSLAEAAERARPTPHVREILARRGITVLPDILAMLAGVKVSYFDGCRKPGRVCPLGFDEFNVSCRNHGARVPHMLESMRKHTCRSRGPQR